MIVRIREWLFFTMALCDAAEPWQLGFQDAATPMMQGIIDLHHDIFFFLSLILDFVSCILVRALWHFHYKKNPIPQRIVHGTTIEIIRAIFPSIILITQLIFLLSVGVDPILVAPCSGSTEGDPGPSGPYLPGQIGAQASGASTTEEDLLEQFLIQEEELAEGRVGGMPDLPIFNVHNIMHESFFSRGTAGGEEAQPLVINSSTTPSVSELLEMAAFLGVRA